MNIRPVGKEEQSKLFEMIRYTFIVAFGPANKEEDMKLYTETHMNDESLKNEYRNKESLFYFIEADDKTLGYLKLNLGSAQTEHDFEKGLEIERIYVLPGNQGKGVGKRMLAFAQEVAIENKLSPLWLGVWEKNEKAIAFYKRHGFEKYGEHDFFLGNDKQTDWLMKLKA